MQNQRFYMNYCAQIRVFLDQVLPGPYSIPGNSGPAPPSNSAKKGQKSILGTPNALEIFDFFRVTGGGTGADCNLRRNGLFTDPLFGRSCEKLSSEALKNTDFFTFFARFGPFWGHFLVDLGGSGSFLEILDPIFDVLTLFFMFS